MNVDGFAEFSKDHLLHAEGVRRAGSIVLSPFEDVPSYVLGTIAELNKLYQPEGKICTSDDLVATLEDVTRYRLWDTDNRPDAQPLIPTVHAVAHNCSEAIRLLGEQKLIEVNFDGLRLNDAGVLRLGRMAFVAERYLQRNFPIDTDS